MVRKSSFDGKEQLFPRFITGGTPQNGTPDGQQGTPVASAARTHKDLIVWRKAVTLATRVYELTARFPSYDRPTLASQMRRCAVSVASNIAEGAARSSRAEYIRFLDIARGSLSELETQVYVCLELQILDNGAQLEELVGEVGRLLTALIHRLRENRERARGFESPRPLTSH